MSRYKYKKSYSWSADLAYIVGLFASDGCLINNGRHLNITSKDWELIQTVMTILNKKVKVSVKKSNYGGSAFNLQFSDVALYDFLLKTGLTPAKSKTIRKLLIPPEMYRDFLRGYFDGDGTFYGYWDKRWPNSLMYYCALISASPIFLEWIQESNSILALVTKGKLKPGVRSHVLIYAKTDSRKLFNFMYYDTRIPKLSRKYNKFSNFLESDPYGTITPNARVL